jgi:hypothetical protein
MNRSELQQHYFELQRQFEANKTKRAVKTVLAFAVAFFIIWSIIEKPTGWEILGVLVASVFLAVIHVVINGAIFGQLADIQKAENNILESIRKKLQE